jgi:hypothetical protein
MAKAMSKLFGLLWRDVTMCLAAAIMEPSFTAHMQSEEFSKKLELLILKYDGHRKSPFQPHLQVRLIYKICAGTSDTDRIPDINCHYLQLLELIRQMQLEYGISNESLSD